MIGKLATSRSESNFSKITSHADLRLSQYCSTVLSSQGPTAGAWETNPDLVFLDSDPFQKSDI